jgi:hypothetical protein
LITNRQQLDRKPDLTTEKTAEQIWYGQVTMPELPPPPTKYYTNEWYKLVRKMRTDPTIALVRDAMFGALLSAEWVTQEFEGAPEGAKDWVNDQAQKVRYRTLYAAVQGLLDFGWQTYEKVYEVADNNHLTINKLKPLIQDKTEILINEENGDFIGIQQLMDMVDLTNEETLLLNWQVEGTNWYGRPLMANAEQPYTDWVDSNKSANRYDRKVSGSRYVVYFPPGTTKINGVEKDNFNVAKDIVNILESSAGIAIPTYVERFVKELNKDSPLAWKIELLSDTTNQQAAFVERQRYLDGLKVRGLGFPERSILEGQFGTKAEAVVHTDIASTILDERHKNILAQFNEQVTNDILRWGWSESAEDTVKVMPTAVDDEEFAIFWKLYDKITSHPEAFLIEHDELDIDAIRQKLGLPTLQGSMEAE